MITISNLIVASEDEIFVDNISLNINPGELHAIIGPRISGKSFIAHSIFGNPDLEITSGDILFKNKDLRKKNITDRAKLGIFASFQEPPLMSGIPNLELVRQILIANGDKRTPNEVKEEFKTLCRQLGLSSSHGTKVSNPANDFGDSKKTELLHMLMVDPTFFVLDEIEDGVDIDDFPALAASINKFLKPKKAGIVISKDPAFLELLNITHWHIMVQGEFKQSGTDDSYKRIISDDYAQFL